MPRPKRYCRGCKERAPLNAFPRGSALCYGCSDGLNKRQRRAAMPAQLVDLQRKLAAIERDSEWQHQFVTGLIKRFENGSIRQLSDKQAAKLNEIHGKYTHGE